MASLPFSDSSLILSKLSGVDFSMNSRGSVEILYLAKQSAAYPFIIAFVSSILFNLIEVKTAGNEKLPKAAMPAITTISSMMVKPLSLLCF